MSKPINDGGPAFPTPNLSDPYAGISKRDYFAAAALTGLLAQHASCNNVERAGYVLGAPEPVYRGSWIVEVGEGDSYEVANDAYLIADAMIERRVEAEEAPHA